MAPNHSQYTVTTSSKGYAEPKWVSLGPPKTIQGELDEDHRISLDLYILNVLFVDDLYRFGQYRSETAVRVPHM